MLTTVVFIILIKAVLPDFNVALNKIIIFCNTTEMSQLMVDGIRDLDKAEEMNESCAENYTFQIHLGAEFIIHYVVFYEGNTNDTFWTLDEIVVELDNTKCSNYRTISPGTPHTKGIRINCLMGFAEKVSVKVNDNRGFTISEVEVYTMASAMPEDDVAIYYGCFKSFNVSFVYTDESTWKNCLSACRSNGTFAAFSNNATNCYCGEIFDKNDTVSLDQCPACETHFCGGNETYSVYIVLFQLPYYLGCHELPETNMSYYVTTIAECLLRCFDFPYIAVMVNAECFCYDTRRFFKLVNDTLCDSTCLDDIHDVTFCGGENHASIYMTKADDNQLNMLELMRCVGGFDHHGICIDGCEPDYIGAHCIEVIQNYCVDIDPCIDLMNTECVAINTTYTCQCLTGFRREKLSGPCFEILILCHNFDPCLNKSNSECVIIVSTYRCECVEGYAEQDGVCEDIDECEYDPCDEKTSKCFNMEGAYGCDCFEPYLQLTEFLCLSNKTYTFEETSTNFFIYYLLMIPLQVLMILVIVLMIFRKVEKHKKRPPIKLSRRRKH